MKIIYLFSLLIAAFGAVTVINTETWWFEAIGVITLVLGCLTAGVFKGMEFSSKSHSKEAV